MEEARQYAYRMVLYWAMLDIRLNAWHAISGRRWNPARWRRVFRQVRFDRDVAEWLHNLAHFSSFNFEGFREDWFWAEYDEVRRNHDWASMPDYRKFFDSRVEEFRCRSNQAS